ncbi:aldolase [Acidithiobacillus montserratensis]|uniref:Aldolase n=1 Tax=Acidithiobacillus montserratensis TaxID=2729135 RepID=A0ACD5HC39_9PROT|nr:aldolase [Acidithiobacillus montserratensis]MBN2680816.1 aldolase [Acidithiobacillaceae bacterium]MBU2747630.1 aldolase [Acidithiobacillus montserratensis]
MSATRRPPLGIPDDSAKRWTENYQLATQESGRLFLMAGDQKVEHLNDDFVGAGVAADDADPEHLFRIANAAPVGCFAAQMGLISHYGRDYPEIPYLLKLNSKTHLLKTAEQDPLSSQWQSMSQVQDFVRHSGLKVVGVGYTIYPGSTYEAQMFSEAARLIQDAHNMGLLAVIWAYPRGKAVGKREQDPHLIAGAAGLVACLGADFAKVNPPLDDQGNMDAYLLGEAVAAAGRTQVICAGGSETDAKSFLQRLHEQIHLGGTQGCATGRNVHQRSQPDAIAFCRAIHAMVVHNQDVEEAVNYLVPS